MDSRNAKSFMDQIFNHWPIAVVISSIIFSWAHFQTNLENLQEKVGTLQLQAATINGQYTNISGDIKSINAKLDIIIKKVQL